MSRSSVGTGSLVIVARPWTDASATVGVDGGLAPFPRSGVDRRARASVALLPAGGDWTSLGSREARGIVPEGLQLVADEHGPLDASFVLARDPRVPWSELAAFTPCKAEVGGVNVWTGRVQMSPGERGAQLSMNVQGRGGQDYLADRPQRAFFTHQRMADWQDVRSGFAALTVDLAKFTQGWSVGADNGAITMGWPLQSGNPVAFTYPGIVLDTGATGAAKKISVVATTPANWTWGAALKVSASDSLPVVPGVSDTYTVSSLTGGALTSALNTVTLTTARRYLLIWVDQNATGTPTTDSSLRLERITVYGASGYESGGYSALRASDVIAAAAGMVPALSADLSGITQSTLVDGGSHGIPHLTSEGRATPRQLVEAANAYHNGLWTVDTDLRLRFADRPTTAAVQIGEWSGESWSGGTQSTAEDVYNEVVVTGSSGDGGTVEVVRTAASPLLDARGITRTKELTVDAVLTTATATAIADAWLNEASRTQLSGNITVTGFGSVRRAVTSEGLHPSQLLLLAGQRVMLDMADPDTGSWGRLATLGQVAYTHEGESAALTIDNSRTKLEALLTRLGALQAT